MSPKYGRFFSSPSAQIGDGHQSADKNSLYCRCMGERGGYIPGCKAGFCLRADVHLQQNILREPARLGGAAYAVHQLKAVHTVNERHRAHHVPDLVFCRCPIKCSAAPSYACSAFFCTSSCTRFSPTQMGSPPRLPRARARHRSSSSRRRGKYPPRGVREARGECHISPAPLLSEMLIVSYPSNDHV